MAETKIILRNLGQSDYALLSKELGAHSISPAAVDKTPGTFGEPVSITVILAIGAATSVSTLAIGLAAWLMKKSDLERIHQSFDIEHADGRIEHREFDYTKDSESATDPKLLEALQKAIPKFSTQDPEG